MKQFFSKILFCFFSVAVIALYLFSTMGYGVHECIASGSKDVILLFGESPCEYLHSHELKNGDFLTHSHSANADDSVHKDCVDYSSKCHSECSCSADNCGNSCSEQHDDNCCKTIVFTSTQAQQAATQKVSFDTPVQNLLSCSLLVSLELAYCENIWQESDFVPIVIGCGSVNRKLSSISTFII